MAEAEADEETDQLLYSPPGLGFSSPAPHAAMIAAARGDEQEEDGEFGHSLQLELDADEEGGLLLVEMAPPLIKEALALPPSSPSPAIVLVGEEAAAISSNAFSPQQAAAGLGRRLLGAIGPSKPPGVIHRAKLGLGLVLHLRVDHDQEGDAPHHRDTKGQGLVLTSAPIIHSSPSSVSSFSDAVNGFGDQDGVDCALAATHDSTRAVQDQEEEVVHKCSDANSSMAIDEASAPEGQGTSAEWPQVDQESAVGDISAERGASTVDDTDDAKGQQLVDQDTSDQCKQTDGDIDVGEELVLEEGLGDKWGPTNNVLTIEDWEKPVKQGECAANGNDIALEGQEKAVEQCTAGELGATMDDSVVEDQEMVEPEGAIDKQGATTAMEDQEKAMEQCAGDKSTASKDESAVEEKEKVVEQEGALDKRGTIKDGNAVEYQEEEVVEQGFIDEQSAIEDNIAGDDQEKVVQQCTCYDLRATMDDNDVGSQEVVEQDVIDKRGETTACIAVEDQENAVEQCTSDELGATMDDNAVGDQEVVEQDVIEGGETIDDIAVEDIEKVVEQCTADEFGATENDDVVEDHEVVVQGITTEMGATMDDKTVEDHEVLEQSAIDERDGIAVEDQEKVWEQCTTDELGATENDDAAEDHEVAEQGVITEMGATMDDNVVEDHEVVEQSVIDERHATTDDIAVEDQEKAVEQCAVDESRATKDENAVEEKEKLVEQGVIGKPGAMPMDDIAVKDQEKAVEQYFSNELITNKDENVLEERKKVAEQGVIVENGGIKDDIDVEEQENVKEQGIIDKWYIANEVTALEDQKNVVELCIGDERRSIKSVFAVHNQMNMLEQSIRDEQGATKGEFTVEKHKDVVERHRHEWGTTEDDLAVYTAASGGVSGISSSEVYSVTVSGSDGGTMKKEKVKLCVGYPQRPGKLNCPFYMSTGCCSYGLSCHFNHPPLKAKSDVSSFPSEQGNHVVAEILELNRVGLPIREGARNCAYYMRNGTCRYGKKCHFNHPEPVIDAQFYPPTGWEDNAVPCSPRSKKSSDHATLEDTSYLKRSCDDVTLDDTSYSKRCSDHATLDDTSSSSEVLPPNILRILLPPQKVPHSTEEKVIKVTKDPNWSSASDDSADSSDGPLCKQEYVDYPERPGRPECPFFMRFGDCKFASACKYHHSKERVPSRHHLKDPLLGEELMEYRERPGEPECPFYMKSRFCKFGAECKFHHPKDLIPSWWRPTTTKKSVAANEHHPAAKITLKDHICQQQQYPERPGQPDCRYYMQFGKCKYLSACIFHHPKDRLPSGWHPSDPSHSDQYDTWQPTNRIDDLCHEAQIGPEIPGMPECPLYMETGTCQFGSACEFRHPKDRFSTTEEAIDQGTDLAHDKFTRSENVVQQQEQTMYPERPGKPECFYYMKHGSCKFQMNCKYHHPRDRHSKKPDHFVSTCYS